MGAIQEIRNLESRSLCFADPPGSRLDYVYSGVRLMDLAAAARHFDERHGSRCLMDEVTQLARQLLDSGVTRLSEREQRVRLATRPRRNPEGDV
jgi:hypothetical protein